MDVLLARKLVDEAHAIEDKLRTEVSGCPLGARGPSTQSKAGCFASLKESATEIERLKSLLACDDAILEIAESLGLPSVQCSTLK